MNEEEIATEKKKELLSLLHTKLDSFNEVYQLDHKDDLLELQVINAKLDVFNAKIDMVYNLTRSWLFIFYCLLVLNLSAFMMLFTK